MIIYNNYVVLILGIINMVVLLVMGLILVHGLFDFNVYHMYLLRFGVWIIVQGSMYNWFPTSIYWYVEIYVLHV